MLIKHGNSGVCIDATYNVNNYDFHLITILVLDDYQEEIPVAFVVSNLEDKIVLVHSLESIKLKCNRFQSCLWFSQTWLDNFLMHGKKFLMLLALNVYGVDGKLIVHGERH